jgi:hypothetical protein
MQRSLADGDVRSVLAQEVPDEGPLPQILRLEERRILPARDRVVGVADQEAVGVPVRDLGLAAIGANRRDGKRPLPPGEPAVLRQRDLIPVRALAVVDDRRPALLRQEAGAAVHGVTRERRLELGGLPGPVQQVRAGDVDEAVRPLTPPLMPQDVVQVVDAVQGEGGVRVARRALAARVHQVVVERQV